MNPSHRTCLQGKVSVESLPALTPPFPPDAPRRKRLSLPQGELASFHDGEPGMRYIAGIVLQPGSVRGNHYHEAKNERLYVVAGELDLVLEDVDTGERETVRLGPGDLACIPPRVAHALRVVQAGYAIEFSPEAFDAADTFRRPLT